MADHADMTSHNATYTKVMGLLKWGAVACGAIALGVVILISS